VTLRRPRAALAAVAGALVLVGAAPAEPPASVPVPHTLDGGAAPVIHAPDGGRNAAQTAADAGPLSVDDLEVIENLELLEHLPESDVLELLLGSG
jgi:hypothetical protein